MKAAVNSLASGYSAGYSAYIGGLRIARIIVIPVILAVGASTVPAAERYTEQERQRTQHRLDQACEYARRIKLIPIRQELYESCVDKGKDEAFCYDDAISYNGERRNGAPMFYELPDCVKAFEYRRTHRLR